MPAESIRIVALDGIPEIRIGDDLGDIIGNAIARTPGAGPLTPDDVLVITQKIVSKAEGAVVDLTGVVPGAGRFSSTTAGAGDTHAHEVSAAT